MNYKQEKSPNQWITRDINLLYSLSMIIAGLIFILSIMVLININSVYQTNELIQSFLPNDVVNLIIGVPILLISISLAKRGLLLGLLLWPGALLYLLYNYSIYLFSLSFSFGYLIILVLVIINFYSLIRVLISLDSKLIHRELVGSVNERLSGGIIAGMGILFFAQVIYSVVTLLINKDGFEVVSLAIHISDILFAPLWIIGGITLFLKKEFGYILGLALLFQASMLFIALIVVMLIQPILVSQAIIWADIVFISVLGLISFGPFYLFARTIQTKTKNLSK